MQRSVAPSLVLCLLLLTISLLPKAKAANFTQCHLDIVGLLTEQYGINFSTNATLITSKWPDPIYHGPIRGFHVEAASRPLTLTVTGCKNACGTSPQLNGVLDAFQILTTWVLPIIALLCQFPYESSSVMKGRNLEAFGNWIGAPAAALTTTIYNIEMIQQCQQLASRAATDELRLLLNKTYFILSCVNQYEFSPHSTLEKQPKPKRDTALLRGVLFPLITNLQEDQAIKLKNITTHLAFQLRLQRRKAVWPLAFNILWFILAFVISIVTAFAQLGDNTTAHSLALGLLLCWLPVLVVTAIVDRNPVSSTRCKVLIERWLYNVDAILGDDGAQQQQQQQQQQQLGPNSPLMGAQQSQQQQWNESADLNAFDIGEFIGQGRKLRYCGVTSAVLAKLAPKPEETRLLRDDLVSSHDFDNQLITRRVSWWIIWSFSQIIVAVGFAMAFMVSFKTPTVGLGCRSLLYVVWFFLSTVSWFGLGISQEPSVYLRIITWMFNGLATLLLFVIMGLQVVGGLNTCLCKASVFGTSAFGGYMDFESGQFYHETYDVKSVWGAAAGFGLTDLMIPIFWAARRWTKSATLWKGKEDDKMKLQPGVELDWLM